MLQEKAKGFTHDKKDNASVDWYSPRVLLPELSAPSKMIIIVSSNRLCRLPGNTRPFQS